MWPRPDSQSLSYYSDDRSSESGGPRRRSKAKAMPKSFVTASTIIGQSDGESDSQGSPTKVKLMENTHLEKVEKVIQRRKPVVDRYGNDSGRFKSL